MAFQNFTMNLSALNNISAPNLNLNSTDIFHYIIVTSNFYTNDHIVTAIMIILTVILYVALTQRNQVIDIGYDDARAINISLAASSLIGLEMVLIGWSPNFYMVGKFFVLWLISYIFIIIYENKD